MDSVLLLFVLGTIEFRTVCKVGLWDVVKRHDVYQTLLIPLNLRNLYVEEDGWSLQTELLVQSARLFVGH